LCELAKRFSSKFHTGRGEIHIEYAARTCLEKLELICILKKMFVCLGGGEQGCSRRMISGNVDGGIRMKREQESFLIAKVRESRNRLECCAWWKAYQLPVQHV